MNLKKSLCLFLATLVMVTAAGCGGGSSSEGGKDGDSMMKSSIELPKYEITDSKVKFLCWNDPTSLKTPSSWYYALNEKLKEEYNCELEFVQTTFAELPTKAAQLVMSGNSPDLIFYREEDNPLFVANGIVQPVDEYIDWNLPIWSDLKDVNDKYRINGKVYAMSVGVINDGYTYYWTKNLEDLGLESPRSLYKKGEWTFSKMEEYAKQLTKYSSTGAVDVYGVAYENDLYLATGSEWVNFNDGKYTNNLRDNALADFYNFNSRLTYDLGVRPINQTNSDLFKQGKVAMYVYRQFFGTTHMGEELKNGEVDWAPAPKLDSADKYYVSGKNNALWVAEGAKNPGGAMAYIAIWHLANGNIDEATIETMQERDRTLYGYDDEDFALNLEMQDKSKFEILLAMERGCGTNWSSTEYYQIINEVLNYKKPWATAVEEYYPRLQAGVDEINSKMEAVAKQ